MASLISKGRKPKFDLHLKIHDLNNVPLVSGSCMVKYHFSHSLLADHRGRTPKSPILNHRVDFGPCARVISSIRIAVDRSGTLAECPFELEVVQEMDPDQVARGEDKTVRLGVVRLNLSEYVEESEAFVRDISMNGGFGSPAAIAATGSSNTTTNTPNLGGVMAGSGAASLGVGTLSPPALRKRTGSMSTSASGAVTPGGPSDSRPTTAVTNSSATSGAGTSAPPPATTPNTSTSAMAGAHTSATISEAVEVEDGIVRRYLLQDSKINSTLRVSILMMQVDGDRTYVAPPLRSAPVFGGIAGLLTGDQGEQPDEGGQLPTTSRSKDVNSEIYDMYRRVLVASWTRHPDELPADECIEDIFSGGDGWKTDPNAASNSITTTTLAPISASSSSYAPSPRSMRTAAFSSLDGEAMGTPYSGNGSTDTLKPHHYAHHLHVPHHEGTGSHFLQIPSMHFGSSSVSGGSSAGSSAASSPSESAFYHTLHRHSSTATNATSGSAQSTHSSTPNPTQPSNTSSSSPMPPHATSILHRRKHSTTSIHPPAATSSATAALFSLAPASSSAPSLYDQQHPQQEATSPVPVTVYHRPRGESFVSILAPPQGHRGAAASLAAAAAAANTAAGAGESMVRRAREVDEFSVREDLVAWSFREQVA